MNKSFVNRKNRFATQENLEEVQKEAIIRNLEEKSIQNCTHTPGQKIVDDIDDERHQTYYNNPDE